MICDQTSYVQPTLLLYDVCLEVLTVHGNELRLFFYFNYFCRALSITALGTISYQRGVGPRFEPITYPTTSGCATCYVSVVGN